MRKYPTDEELFRGLHIDIEGRPPYDPVRKSAALCYSEYLRKSISLEPLTSEGASPYEAELKLSRKIEAEDLRHWRIGNTFLRTYVLAGGHIGAFPSESVYLGSLGEDKQQKDFYLEYFKMLPKVNYLEVMEGNGKSYEDFRRACLSLWKLESRKIRKDFLDHFIQERVKHYTFLRFLRLWWHYDHGEEKNCDLDRMERTFKKLNKMVDKVL